MGLFSNNSAESEEVSVWQRREQEEAFAAMGVGADARISDGKFNLVLGGMIVYGLLINAVIVLLLGEPIINLMVAHPGSSIAFLIGYIVCVIAGTRIAYKSDKPLVSFAGYNLIVVPMGVLLAMMIPGFPTFTIAKAAALTGFITLFIMGLSSAFPKLFLSMGRALFITLLITLVVELISVMIFGYSGSIFDIVFVFLFSMYIGFDFARAQLLPKTVDNAVDCALAIYVDIINLFIRILSLLGRDR